MLGTVFTLVINNLLSMVIKELTTFEKHQTGTDHNLSLVIKLLISQFFNTAMIYYIISKILPKPMLSSAGLVVTITSLITVSGFIQIATNAIQIPAILRWFNLWRKYGDL